jgi:cytochrome c-type biogenesis protein CcmE
MAETSTILRDASVRSNRPNKNLKFIVGGVVVVGLIVYLIFSAVQSAGAYYREVGEVLGQQSALSGKMLRVSGNIVTDSITYDAPTLDLTFKISDPKDAGKQIPIHFHGVKPDQMDRPGSSAIVDGKLLSNGTVDANELMLKCPSRYEQLDEITVQAVK